jgi:hypothetical protein
MKKLISAVLCLACGCSNAAVAPDLGTNDTDSATSDAMAQNDSGIVGSNDASGSVDSGLHQDSGPVTDSGVTTPDSGTTASDAGTPPDAGSSNHIQTVFMILMENHNWSDVYQNTASAPYINSLLSMGSYATNYFDNPNMVHPSEPNYIWLESGDNLGVTTDSNPSSNHQSTTQHLVTLLGNAGVSWKAYEEGISGTTCPITGSGLFAPRHCPMLFFDDIVGNPPSSSSQTCIQHIRPYTEFHNDLTANTVARYNFITPNLCDDMHNDTGCTNSDSLLNGDQWLQTEVPLIMASQAYQNNGVIFITWDESETNGAPDVPIGMIVLSPKAKGHGYNNSAMYYHSSTLRTIQEIFGVTPLLRDAANQPDLSDLFTSFP